MKAYNNTVTTQWERCEHDFLKYIFELNLSLHKMTL